MKTKKSRALFIGRFQPIHRGHIHAIRDISRKAGTVVVVIGSAQFSRDSRNPLNADEREKMLRAALDSAKVRNYEVVKVPDLFHPKKWVKEIQKQVRFDVVYSMNPWTIRCFREAGIEVRPHKLYNEEVWNGTGIRARIRAGQPWKGLVPGSVSRFLEIRRMLRFFKPTPQE
jgi:nicotinamide-nucleotide adenylyltransferase